MKMNTDHNQSCGLNEVVLRGNVKAVCTFIKKLERSSTFNLTAHQNILQQKEANTCKISAR